MSTSSRRIVAIFSGLCLLAVLVSSLGPSCEDPGIPQHGSHQKEYKFPMLDGSNILFNCKDGYTMSGSVIATCRGGEWNREVPTCIENCKDPGNANHGSRSILGNEFDYGTSVTYQCDAEYILEGAATIYCTGPAWSHNVPECKAGCEPFYKLENMAVYGGYEHGDTVTFTCDPDHDMAGIAESSCDNGKWSHDPPKCIPQKDDVKYA